MSDWNRIREARGLPIPEAEMEALSPILQAIEDGLRPLAAVIPLDIEPAPVFRPDGEEA
jgi:hypothetical protein